ncbi:MAG TPA: MMPL family transporter [Rhodoblastus sp.]|nr:MMPL family transporter [Rhodoblastus sp.]
MAGLLEKIVRFCTFRPLLVVGLTLALTLAAGVYSVKNFAIDTNTAKLISPDIPWRQDEIAYARAFPQFDNLIAAVIDGPTPEAVDGAADRLTAALNAPGADAAAQAHVKRAWRPDRNAYLDREGLLLTDKAGLETTLADLVARRQLLGGLAADPSLRGLMRLISGAMEAAEKDQARFQPFLTPLDRLATTIETALAGRPAPLSWRLLLDNREPTVGELRRIVLIEPNLDFGALEPGAKATREVRATAATLGIDKAAGFVFRLTGQTPLADEEFGTVAENYELNLAVTVALVALVLFLALRSGKIIFAVLVTLFVGLVITMGVGLLAVERLNLISVAFAALFIGLGVDFGIQFATRYREERHRTDDLKEALAGAIRSIGYSLSLAAMSLVAGFFCFLPTEFKGVSELGLIAGLGMIVAFVATVAFMPALLAVIRPGPEKRPVETASLAAVDRWIEHHRALVLIGTAAVVLAGVPALLKLQFDSNPMHLRSDKVESVSTFYDLARDPQTAPDTISILAADLKQADELAARLTKLPTVARVVTLSTFLPQDQTEKLAMVGKARAQLADALDAKPAPAPADADNLKEIGDTLDLLDVAEGQGAPPPMLHFTRAVAALSKATPDQRAAAQRAIFANFEPLLQTLRTALAPKAATRADVPEDLTRDWIAADGRSRVEVFPKGETRDNDALAKFASDVRAIAPHATGAPITVVDAGATIVRAFAEAGALAFIAIFAILYIAMRSVKDVALALGPLVLAGIMSLEAAQLLGMSLDFANIIALPLMFAVGVAFHIYYLIAWRKGVADMLASSLTRAIFFSSLTTGIAFGSLCLSSHPGTAGMGKLLAISLFFTLLAAFVIVPAFLGPPPDIDDLPGDPKRIV